MRDLTDEIQVYLLPLNQFDDAIVNRSLQLLTDEEQGSAARIRHGETHRNFVMVRSLLRVLLARHLRGEPSTIQLAFSPKGKPRLAGTEPDQGLVFNVSHSGDYGLIAITYDTALGVDVERWRSHSNPESIAARCFSPEELAYWKALPPEHQRQAFHALWSFKEAFAKATGEGISIGLESCAISLPTHPRLISIPERFGSPEDWRLNDIDAGTGYSAGICYRGDQRKLHYAEPRELVNYLFNLVI